VHTIVEVGVLKFLIITIGSGIVYIIDTGSFCSNLVIK